MHHAETALSCLTRYAHLVAVIPAAVCLRIAAVLGKDRRAVDLGHCADRVSAARRVVAVNGEIAILVDAGAALLEFDDGAVECAVGTTLAGIANEVATAEATPADQDICAGISTR